MTKIISKNPSKNFQENGFIESSSFDEISEKVNLAHQTKDKWANLEIKERVNSLKKVVSAFEQKKDELALLISKEMGMPISQAFDDINMGISYFQWYFENAEKYLTPEITYEDETSIHKVFYEPKGVVAVIIPWNFPFSNFVWQVGQNLIAGNVVVLKHSEEVPLFAKEIEKIFESSNFPKGVFNQVFGNAEVGEFLVNQNIDMICFTGSTNVGKKLYKIGADKFISALMELAGSAPGIIFEDTDIDSVIDSIYINKFLNCGQVCDGLKRLIVHENKFDEVVNKLKQILLSKKIGIAEDRSTEIGPLVSKKQLEVLKEQVQDAIDKGANLIFGGKQPQNLLGAFFEPTLLTSIKSNMKVWNEEIFGPVLPIISFKTYEEAIALANDTKYGLGGYVFTNNKNLYTKTVKDLKTGMITQNNLTYVMPCNPFGGYKKSGLGREHGKYGFHEVCQIKVIAMEK